MNSETFCVQDNDAVLCGPGYARPAQADYTAQRLHNSQVGHPPHGLPLCDIREMNPSTRRLLTLDSSINTLKRNLNAAHSKSGFIAPVELATSGCGADRCGLLTAFKHGVQGDDVFCVGLEAS